MFWIKKEKYTVRKIYLVFANPESVWEEQKFTLAT